MSANTLEQVEGLELQYVRDTASAALNTIVTPAANTAGLIIQAVSLAFSGGASSEVRLMAKTTAPTSINDTAAFTIAEVAIQAGVVTGICKLILPLFIPAGFGLYEQAGTGAVISRAHVLYRVAAS